MLPLSSKKPRTPWLLSDLLPQEQQTVTHLLTETVPQMAWTLHKLSCRRRAVAGRGGKNALQVPIRFPYPGEAAPPALQEKEGHP